VDPSAGNPLSTLDECERRFAAIRASRLDDELRSHLRALFDLYLVISFELGRGSVFWRGRRAEAGPFHKVAQMSHPPSEYASTGRLNDPGYPCLYGATRRSTVLAELGAKSHEHFQFIGFRVKPGTTLRIGAIGELFHVYKTGYIKSLGADPENALGRMLNSEGSERGKQLIYIDAFLASLLADRDAQEKNYLPTRILATLAYEKSGAHGLFYPSVQDHLGMNITVLPVPYDSQTHPVCCQYVRVSKVREFGVFDYEIVLEGQNVGDDGTIMWQLPKAKTITTFFGLTEREHAFLKERPQDDGNALMELTRLSRGGN
jgi:RES domain